MIHECATRSSMAYSQLRPMALSRRQLMCASTHADATQVAQPAAKRNGRSRIPSPPYKAVVTGSTKGIGLELAREFLRAGDQVIISSRDDDRVRQATKELHSEFGANAAIRGVTCDVTKEKDVADLADYAKEEFGNIHFWINNAGTNGFRYGPLLEFSTDELREILETNILGVFISCKEAIRVMRDQEEDGHILNMEGAGSNGRPTPRIAAYGASRRAIAQFNESLNEELKLQDISNIGAHIISPGMCVTDLLMSGNLTGQAKFFINCLAEHPSVPAKHLVPLVRRLPAESNGSAIRGRRVAYLTQTKAFTQIFKRLVFNERKNRHILEEE